MTTQANVGAGFGQQRLRPDQDEADSGSSKDIILCSYKLVICRLREKARSRHSRRESRFLVFLSLFAIYLFTTKNCVCTAEFCNHHNKVEPSF